MRRSRAEGETGDDPSLPVYVAIKGHVFDVTGKDAYLKNGPYHGNPALALALALSRPPRARHLSNLPSLTPFPFPLSVPANPQGISS